MQKSTDIQSLKTGSPNHKHRRHAGLFDRWMTVAMAERDKREWRERMRTCEMYDSPIQAIEAERKKKRVVSVVTAKNAVAFPAMVCGRGKCGRR